MKLLQAHMIDLLVFMCPESNKYPLTFFVQNWSHQRTHMNSGQLLFTGEGDYTTTTTTTVWHIFKHYKKCINKVKLQLQTLILNNLLTNADYYGLWKMSLIKVLLTKDVFEMTYKIFKASYIDNLVYFSLFFFFNKIANTTMVLTFGFIFWD